MRWSFVGLWIVGIASFIGLLISIGSDFRSVNSMNVQNIELTNPHVSSLEVMPIQNTQLQPVQQLVQAGTFRHFRNR